jgi:hypothetical protein
MPRGGSSWCEARGHAWRAGPKGPVCADKAGCQAHSCHRHLSIVNVRFPQSGLGAPSPTSPSHPATERSPVKPRSLLHSLASVLVLLVVSLALPHAAFSQQASPGQGDLAPETQARLMQAVEDPGLAPWQREIMLGLARTGTTSPVDSAAGGLRSAPLDLASGALDGAWNQLVAVARERHTAIYDPVRDRMLVFGGCDASLAPLNDVWALSLAGTPVWTHLAPSGTPPTLALGTLRSTTPCAIAWWSSGVLLVQANSRTSGRCCWRTLWSGGS